MKHMSESIHTEASVTKSTPEVKQMSPFTETQIQGIVGSVCRKLTKMFAGPFMNYHMDNVRITKINLESKASEETRDWDRGGLKNKIRTVLLGVGGRGKDFSSIEEVLSKDYRDIKPNLWKALNDETIEEITQKVELLKQSHFVDTEVPRLLRKIRKETILSYLSLRDARDKNASPEKQKRLEKMFREQRQILKEIATYHKDPSLILKEALLSSIKYFKTKIGEYEVPVGENGFPKVPTSDSMMRWFNAGRYREAAQVYKNMLERLKAKYPPRKALQKSVSK